MHSNHPYSEGLKKFYEGSCGFTCINASQGRRCDEFRRCRKKISTYDACIGEWQRLASIQKAMQLEITKMLQGGGNDASASEMEEDSDSDFQTALNDGEEDGEDASLYESADEVD